MAVRVADRESNPQVIRIGGFLKRSAVNGPGVRSVIWVQGCPIRCEGCFNKDLWSITGGKDVGIRQLFKTIISTSGIDGVTFSGGEPFFQAEALAVLAEKIHSQGLSVMTFSGYPYGLLAGSHERSWNRLMAATDLLISGPYIAQPDFRNPDPGATGKEYHFLTDRIRPGDLDPDSTSALVEYTIGKDGTVLATGFPDATLHHRFHAIGTKGGF